MGWLAAIGTLFQIILLVLQEWSKWSDTQKQKAKDILSDIPKANSPVSVTRIFDEINRL